MPGRSCGDVAHVKGATRIGARRCDDRLRRSGNLGGWPDAVAPIASETVGVSVEVGNSVRITIGVGSAAGRAAKQDCKGHLENDECGMDPSSHARDSTIPE